MSGWTSAAESARGEQRAASSQRRAHVDACGQAALHQCARDLSCFFLRSGGAQDDAHRRHLKSLVAPRAFRISCCDSTAMPTTIKFGTSGWRAIVAEEFNFANV